MTKARHCVDENQAARYVINKFRVVLFKRLTAWNVRTLTAYRHGASSRVIFDDKLACILVTSIAIF